jgi:hypothetical protein
MQTGLTQDEALARIIKESEKGEMQIKETQSCEYLREFS